MATFQAYLPLYTRKKVVQPYFHLIFSRENTDCEVVASQLAPVLNGWYQLWDQKTLPTFLANASVFIRALGWRKTEAFSRNVGKVFQSQSWYQRTLFSFTCTYCDWTVICCFHYTNTEGTSLLFCTKAEFVSLVLYIDFSCVGRLCIPGLLVATTSWG